MAEGPLATAPDPLGERLESLRRQLPPTTHLLAVSKGQPSRRMRAAVALGLRSFGESRQQVGGGGQLASQGLQALPKRIVGGGQGLSSHGGRRRCGRFEGVI